MKKKIKESQVAKLSEKSRQSLFKSIFLSQKCSEKEISTRRKQRVAYLFVVNVKRRRQGKYIHQSYKLFLSIHHHQESLRCSIQEKKSGGRCCLHRIKLNAQIAVYNNMKIYKRRDCYLIAAAFLLLLQGKEKEVKVN
jgi:hypothetical protein